MSQTCDYHHLVLVLRTHDLVVNLLNVVLTVNRLLVDVRDDDTVLDAVALELACGQSGNLHTVRDVVVFLILLAQLGESATQRGHVTALGNLGVALVVLEGHSRGAQLVVAVVTHLGLVTRTELVHLLLHLTAILHGGAIHLHNHVTLLNACLHGGAAVVNLGDIDAFVRGGDVVLLGLVGVKLFVLDAKHCTLDCAVLLEVGHHFLHRVARYGERAA